MTVFAFPAITSCHFHESTRRLGKSLNNKPDHGETQRNTTQSTNQNRLVDYPISSLNARTDDVGSVQLKYVTPSTTQRATTPSYVFESKASEPTMSAPRDSSTLRPVTHHNTEPKPS